MPSQRIDSLESRLEATFSRADDFSANPAALADYARYLCILVSGFLERSVEYILHDYTKQRSPSPIDRYVGHHLGRIGNLNAQRLLELVGRFDTDWKDDLRTFFDSHPEHREAINSIRVNRNNIAHGIDVPLSYHDIRSYYISVRKTIRHLDDIVN